MTFLMLVWACRAVDSAWGATGPQKCLQDKVTGNLAWSLVKWDWGPSFPVVS